MTASERLKVLLISQTAERALDRISAVDHERLDVIPAWADFQEEAGRDWPGPVRAGEVLPRPDTEREGMLAEADVLYLDFVFPKSLAPRARNLRWAHFAFAGVSNLMGTSWWGAPFAVTTTRGFNAALPIAESVMAAAFMFARRLDVAVNQSRDKRFSNSQFAGMQTLAGKTMGIVGLGGIGTNVARIARGCGMRVLASRRSAGERRQDVDGVDELYPPAEQQEMLSRCDFVAVTAMLTPETEGMLGAAAFEAMKPGAYLMNVARGEILDEGALIAALSSGRLAGAYLDVWYDDMSSPPTPELLAAPNIVFSPHVSNRAEVPHSFSVDLFCDNLRRLLDGEALVNEVDWQRGY